MRKFTGREERLDRVDGGESVICNDLEIEISFQFNLRPFHDFVFISSRRRARAFFAFDFCLWRSSNRDTYEVGKIMQALTKQYFDRFYFTFYSRLTIILPSSNNAI